MTDRKSRRPLALVLFVLALGFVALGVWQVERRAWKLDLIAQVEGRIHARPIAPPTGPVDPTAIAYTRVTANGTFRNEAETLVRAVSDLGAGYWVVTPFETDGLTILVNRGFVTQEQARGQAWQRPGGPVVVTGLIRASEPGGGFLRANDPAAGNWYSRDVDAIAQARGIAPVAPYFIDEDQAGDGQPPIGGLTVVAFSNNHLVYAVTWFGLALMCVGAAVMVWRRPRSGSTRSAL